MAKSLILGLMLLAVIKGTVGVVSQHVAKAFKDPARVPAADVECMQFNAQVRRTPIEFKLELSSLTICWHKIWRRGYFDEPQCWFVRFACFGFAARASQSELRLPAQQPDWFSGRLALRWA